MRNKTHPCSNILTGLFLPQSGLSSSSVLTNVTNFALILLRYDSGFMTLYASDFQLMQ